MKFSINSIFTEKKKTEIDINQLLHYLFGLSDLEVKIVESLLFIKQCGTNSPGTCISMLVKELDRDRSLVQRSLSKLMRYGIVSRGKKTMKEFIEICRDSGIEETTTNATNPRGYLYIYNAISNENLKKKMTKINKRGFKIIQESIQHI
ncbi:MAG: hypothetical protein ACTSWY_09930 [Promethearchaeota archaeon]